jgi:hypothetical protein
MAPRNLSTKDVGVRLHRAVHKVEEHQLPRRRSECRIQHLYIYIRRFDSVLKIRFSTYIHTYIHTYIRRATRRIESSVSTLW